MKRSRLLLALVLLVGFVFVVQRGVSLAADSSGNGQIASLTVVLPTPTPKPTIDALHPHPCAAVASGNQVAKLATDSGLTFSEIPQRWILEGRSPWLWVGDWLADDRSVLLTQWHIPLGGYLGYEEITLLDTQSGEIHTLGGRYSPENRGQPFWLEDMQQVGFVGIQPRAIEDWVPYDERPPTDLWLGVSGTITLTEPILQNVLAATGRGHEIVAFQQDPARFTWRDLFTNEEKILDLSNSPYSLQYSKQEGEMTWHVSLPLVAYYGMKGLYILDLATFTLSKVTLDTDQRPGYSTSPYPLTAKWHPTDGRIAVIAAYDDEITWDVDGTFDHISWSP